MLCYDTLSSLSCSLFILYYPTPFQLYIYYVRLCKQEAFHVKSCCRMCFTLWYAMLCYVHSTMICLIMACYITYRLLLDYARWVLPWYQTILLILLKRHTNSYITFTSWSYFCHKLSFSWVYALPVVSFTSSYDWFDSVVLWCINFTYSKVPAVLLLEVFIWLL